MAKKPAASSIKPVTFDPVDAPLWDAFDYYQSLPDDVRASVYLRWFWADPKNWERHLPKKWVLDLSWQEFRYSDVTDRKALKQVIQADTPGIYLFLVRPSALIDKLFPQFVYYVGISNQGDSKRPLSERLADYLPVSIAKVRKRKNVHKLLRLYYLSTWVRFAHVNRPSTELEEAEVALHGYLAPPVPDRDYPPDMKHLKPAF